jgi:hypothetical protein
LFHATRQKENCPITSFYSFFNTLWPANSTVLSPQLELNGCLAAETMAFLHHLLGPNAAYIYMVRDSADFLWAAYNFWCMPSFEQCKPGEWASKNSVRSPQHFHHYITFLSEKSCHNINGLFSNDIKRFAASSFNTGVMPVVISINALEDEDRSSAQLLRIEQHLNKELRMNISMDTKSFLRVNSGAFFDNRGGSHVAKEEIKDGTYEISGFQPMLPISAEFIQGMQ